MHRDLSRRQALTQESVLSYIRDTPLAELGPVLAEIGDKINAHRADANGFVPREVFAQVLSIAGQYTCIEYVPRVVDEQGSALGYLLKRRGSGELGWEGEFQIPGVAVVIEPTRDLMKLARVRLLQELNLDGVAIDSCRLQPAGLEAHYEPERNATCLTVVMTVDLLVADLAVATASGQWKFFTTKNISASGIIEHHQRTLAWLSRADGFEFVDLRELGG